MPDGSSLPEMSFNPLIFNERANVPMPGQVLATGDGASAGVYKLSGILNMRAKMAQDLSADIERVSRIAAVPTILEVVCRTTGMGFAAVARVTEDRWIACGVLDETDFGLRPGGELKVETTICHEIQSSREPVIINNAAEDEVYRKHPAAALYGFQSYISVPIILADGSFFGTLCAIDRFPARL